MSFLFLKIWGHRARVQSLGGKKKNLCCCMSLSLSFSPYFWVSYIHILEFENTALGLGENPVPQHDVRPKRLPTSVFFLRN